MIVTRSHLSEFVDIENISDERLAEIFVDLGHEVAEVRKIGFDDGVVVGKVLSCEKHPDADKLSVCEVDIGSKTLQIVCGASNVKAEQFVAVATVGTTLPDGLLIKDAELRGVASSGMICSAKELGLGDLGGGILELDSSIGSLQAGWKLNNYPALADSIFELELTANRGDALSVYGIARELGAFLDEALIQEEPLKIDESVRGIGRVLQLSASPDSTASVLIKVVENRALALPLIAVLRLFWIDAKYKTKIEAYTSYATHSTGVIFDAFDMSHFREDEDEIGKVRLIKDGGFNKLVANSELSIVGVGSESTAKATDESPLIVLCAFFVAPDELSKALYKSKTKDGDMISRASKGSEPNLGFGMEFFANLIKDSKEALFFSEHLSYEPQSEPRTISINTEEICDLIGQEIDKNKITAILRKLDFGVQASGDKYNFMVTVPPFRHDIFSNADIAEEIVRIVGIDNIASKPLALREQNAQTDGHKKFRFERDLANKSAGLGFFESIHFLFCDKADVARFGFDQIDSKKDIANPITAELNTLRPSLLINLVEAASKNRAMQNPKIALFEIGDVYNSDLVESRQIAFLWSGFASSPTVANHGKPSKIDFFAFASKLSSIIGEFELVEYEAQFLQKGQSAKVVLNGKEIGTLGKLHPSIQKEYDLDTTFVASFDLFGLMSGVVQAKPYSKLQPISRDLSLLLPADQSFGEIKDAIKSLANPLIKEVYAVDLYRDEKLSDQMSLTIRLTIRPDAKALKEEEVSQVTSEVLELISSKFGASLR